MPMRDGVAARVTTIRLSPLTSEIRHATNAGEVSRFTTPFDSEMPQCGFIGNGFAQRMDVEIRQNMFLVIDLNTDTVQVS